MFKRSSANTKANGYIVVVVLLLTAVLLMLGLSMAARTTEQVYLSSQEADSTRVFNAAESGIEEALYQLDSGSVTTDQIANLQNGVYEALEGGLNESAINVEGTKPETISNLSVKQGESITVPVGAEDPVFTWRAPADCASAPGLIVTLYTRQNNGTAYHTSYYPKTGPNESDECHTSLGQAATYAAGTPATNSITLSLSNFATPAPATPVYYRITPLYADITFLSIQNSGAVEIVSTATDDIDENATTNEQRRIKVIRTEPAPPSIFDYAVFSGGELVKQ